MVRKERKDQITGPAGHQWPGNSAKVFLLLFLFACFLPPSAHAEVSPELIDTAGMQRMLSQKIAKAWFYLGNRVRLSESQRQLDAARKQFRTNLELLKKHVRDPETVEVLNFVDFAYHEYDDLVSRPWNRENGALVLDLSETLLETSHDIVKKLERGSGKKDNRIVELSGRQRMLAQRIAKYYIAYQAGFRDSNSVHQLEQAVEEFELALTLLQNEKSNTPQIKLLLTKIDQQWHIIRRFFLDIRKGGIPAMVMVTTDRITQLADQVTTLYVARARTTDRTQK
jgi:hypothetical protein